MSELFGTVPAGDGDHLVAIQAICAGSSPRSRTWSRWWRGRTTASNRRTCSRRPVWRTPGRPGLRGVPARGSAEPAVHRDL